MNLYKLIGSEPIPSSWKKKYLDLLDPIIRQFARLNMSPNTFTTAGFLLGCLSAYFAVSGHIRTACAVLLVSGMFDTIDGKLARDSGRVSKFGALYDSTLDRYSEVIFFFGLAYYFIRMNMHINALITAVALGGSLMVSYIRARAEGLGFECKVGVLQRPERVLLVGFSGLIHPAALLFSLYIIAIFSNVTAIVRMVHVWKQDGGRKKK
jgi:CDP-diacylglycerol--glycerol-3-phosphate 3-phosphatidyltransferase